MVKIAPDQKSYSLYENRNTPYTIVTFLNKAFVIFGLYFGFFKVNRQVKIIIKSIVISQCLLVNGYCAYYVLTRERLTMFYWFSFLFVQKIICSLQLIRIKEENSLYNIMQDLRVIDIGLKNWNDVNILDIKLLATYGFLLSYRLGMTLLFGLRLSVIQSLPFIITFLGLDIIRFTYAFMFYAINYRLKGIGNVLAQTNPDVITVQFLYKSIVDIAEKYKKDHEVILILSLLFNVPQSMHLTYLALEMPMASVPWIEKLNMAVHICEMLFMTLLPAIFAGMLATEVDRIKILLHDLLLQPRSKDSSNEISRFIQYVETRDCRFRVCSVLPLDADLIGIVLSFFVTYIIVIVQFTSK